MIRVGIVGAGWIGRWHAERWKRLPVTLVGFYDTDADRCLRAAEDFGGKAFAALEDLISAVDIVTVCSPTPFHKEAVLMAAARGKQIFCEKPLARYPADAEAMAEACQKAGVRLFVGQVLRFFRQYVRAKQLLDEGLIGTPGLIRMVRGAGHPTGPQGRTWFESVEQAGGTIMEGGVHDLDYARWCLGDVEQVFARGITYRPLPFPGDHILVILRFKNGALGHIEGSWMVTDGRFRQSFLIAGDRGLLEYDSLPAEQLAISLREDRRVPLLPQEPLAEHDDPYFAQLEHFLTCLKEDQEFRVSPRDGIEAVRLAVAALQSVRTGQPVRLEEVV